MAAAASVASAAAAAARKNLKIHSPSRVFFGIGGYVTEGFVNGIGSMNRSVVSAADGIGNIAANAISAPINSLNSSMTGSYSGTMTLDQTNNIQPANITIGFDKHAYSAYVADINNQQGKAALLKRNNSVQL